MILLFGLFLRCQSTTVICATVYLSNRVYLLGLLKTFEKIVSSDNDDSTPLIRRNKAPANDFIVFSQQDSNFMLSRERSVSNNLKRRSFPKVSNTSDSPLQRAYLRDIHRGRNYTDPIGMSLRPFGNVYCPKGVTFPGRLEKDGVGDDYGKAGQQQIVQSLRNRQSNKRPSVHHKETRNRRLNHLCYVQPIF